MYETTTVHRNSARAIAWRQRGTPLPEGIGSAREALSAAGLDWYVEKVPLFAEHNTGSIFVDRHRGVVKVDADGEPMRDKDGNTLVLGVVGSHYRTLQNVDAFSFLEHVAEPEHGDYAWDSAGEVRDGRMVYATLRMRDDLVLDPEGAADALGTFLVATTGHDGGAALRVAVLPVRWACANGQVATFRNASRSVTIQHRSGIEGRVLAARTALGLAVRYQEAFAPAAEKLLRSPMTDDEWTRFVEEHLAPEADEKAPAYAHQRVEERRDSLDRIWRGPTNENIAGTRWAAYQTWAEWVDHERPVQGDEVEARARALVEGTTDTRKNSIFRTLLAAA